MKSIKIQKLDLEIFQKYGQYAPVINPITPFIGKEPIRFYRDIISLGHGPVTVSNTVVNPIPFVVDKMEYHTATGEGFMMLDGDAVICLGIATANGKLPDQLEAFHIPLGVMVYINAGVWHYAPYPVDDKPLNSLVLLPERTYAKDCIAVPIAEEDQLGLEW